MVGPKKYGFWPRINILLRKNIYKIPMRNVKLGIILENKVVQKLILEKNVFSKKRSPKLIFLNEMFFEKIRLIFDIEN